jgi:xanthine dehydrogenase iron-sulfur cluster and FAD-binding subunit A
MAFLAANDQHGVFEGAWIISEAHIAYGGVAPKTIMATETMAALVGNPLSDVTLQAALKAVALQVNAFISFVYFLFVHI